MNRWRLAVVIATALGVVVGGATVAEAMFVASATRSHAVSTASGPLIAPPTFTATPTGHNVVLGWTAGSGGSGYAISGVSNGVSNSCPATGYGAVGTSGSTGYTDSGRFTPQGTSYCYKVATAVGLWTSQTSNPTVAAQIGVVMKSVVVTNGGVTGSIDAGDTIVITFNQPITTSTGPVAGNLVCATGLGHITLGYVSGSGCPGSSLGAFNSITLGNGNGGSGGSVWNGSYIWSAGNTVLTVTVGSLLSGPIGHTASGNMAFTPTTDGTKLQSATGGFHTCDTNTGGGNCIPTATGSF